MKKTNKNSCVITKLWPSVEDMKKDISINLDSNEIINLTTGNKITPYVRQVNKNKVKRYAISFYKNKKPFTLALHRLFFYWHYGYLPSLLDHKDRNSENNNIENLRELNYSGNSRNRNKRLNTTSKYIGVCWSKAKKRWETNISINSKQCFLGGFKDEDDAGQAYNDKIRELGLEEICPLNDTPQERARKNIQFDPLPQEMNHIRDLFLNIEPLVDFK